MNTNSSNIRALLSSSESVGLYNITVKYMQVLQTRRRRHQHSIAGNNEKHYFQMEITYGRTV